MSYLLDTSFLVRLANSTDASHGQAVDALAELFGHDEDVYVAPQNLVELWSVATRPLAANGLELPPEEVAAMIDVLASELLLAAEMPSIFPVLRGLLRSVEVIGKQVHDARLVAVCHVNAIQHLVTFSARHFVRFAAIPPGLEVLEPKMIVRT